MQFIQQCDEGTIDGIAIIIQEYDKHRPMIMIAKEIRRDNTIEIAKETEILIVESGGATQGKESEVSTVDHVY